VAAVLDPARGADPGLVVLSGDGGDRSPPDRETLPLGPCALHGDRPERVALSCTSAAGGHAVLVDEDAPGWTATVDGAAAPVLTADALLRAVRIGPGRHEVVFSYRTPLLREGVAVSVVAWLAWIALALRGGLLRARVDGDAT
jgi:hypothetical protein